MSGHACRALEIEKLFAAKSGRPLFKESLNPFSAIFRKIAANLLLDFVLQGFSELFLFAAKQHFFDGLNRQGRALHDFLR